MDHPPADIVLIVVGAHPMAERRDRPTAYALRDRIRSRLDARGRPDTEVLVCTDVWYLNDESLRDHPAVTIGGPEVNALTAYLADKLPSAFVIDDVLIVQMDVESNDLAACWGATPDHTAQAAQIFIDRYLDTFLT